MNKDELAKEVIGKAWGSLPKLVGWLDNQPGIWRAVYYLATIQVVVAGGWVAIRYDLGPSAEVTEYVIIGVMTLVGGLLSYAGKPSGTAVLLLVWLPQLSGCAWLSESGDKVVRAANEGCNITLALVDDCESESIKSLDRKRECSQAQTYVRAFCDGAERAERIRQCLRGAE